MIRNLLKLIWHSIKNRKFTTSLTILAIALSVMLLLGVEKIRSGARASFANTISGTDLIVGGRSGQVPLLLYSVFRIGNATNNISWESYQDISQQKGVAWTVPISLGDSHRGFRVMGTNLDYFTHYRFGRKQNLSFASGEPFADLLTTVIGADIAVELGYQVGDKIVLAHGAGDVSFIKHDKQPFVVVGILNKTGTPVDRTVHVSLEGIEAIHVGWNQGAPPASNAKPELTDTTDLRPESITAFLVGMESKIAIFGLQRFINTYPAEPLLAILPGVALQELWALMGVAEKALFAVTICVVLTGLVGMLTAILTSLNERRREMAILRSVGARPAHIFALLMGEAGLFSVCGVIIGVVLVYALMWLGQPLIETQFGLYLPISGLTPYELLLLGIVTISGFIIGALPAIRAYLYSLADGLTVKV